MKNSTLSFEAILLVVLLLAGLYGASTFLQSDDVPPGIASPHQETPDMVLVPERLNDTY